MLLVFAGLAATKAVVSKLHSGHKEHQPPEQHRTSRQLVRQTTFDELEPLEKHLSVLGARALQGGLIEPGDDRHLSLQRRLAEDIWAVCETLVDACGRGHPSPSLANAPSPSSTASLLVTLLLLLLAAARQQWEILICALLLLLIAFVSNEQHVDANEAGWKPQLQLQQQRPATQSVGAPRPAAEPSVKATANPLLTGTWHKVDELSDNQEEAARLLRLGGIARTAMKMFKGMEFRLDGTQLEMTALTKVPFLKVSKETYKLDGSVSCYNRRDMRKGKFLGYIKAQPSGGINLYYKWEQPLEGHCCDEILLDGPNGLRIITHLTVEGQSCSYEVVYRRAGSRDDVVPSLGAAPNAALLSLTHHEARSSSDSESSSTASSSATGAKHDATPPHRRRAAAIAAAAAAQRNVPPIAHAPQSFLKPRQSATSAAAAAASDDVAAEAAAAPPLALKPPPAPASPAGRASFDDRKQQQVRQAGNARASMDDRRYVSPFARVSGGRPF